MGEHQQPADEVVACDDDDLCHEFACEGLHAQRIHQQQNAAHLGDHGQEPCADELQEFLCKGRHVGASGTEHIKLIDDVREYHCSGD